MHYSRLIYSCNFQNLRLYKKAESKGNNGAVDSIMTVIKHKNITVYAVPVQLGLKSIPVFVSLKKISVHQVLHFWESLNGEKQFFFNRIIVSASLLYFTLLEQ